MRGLAEEQQARCEQVGAVENSSVISSIAVTIMLRGVAIAPSLMLFG